MEFNRDSFCNIIQRLQRIKQHLIQNQSFYANMISHLSFRLDERSATTYTDGNAVIFNPKYLESLTDQELEFVLEHEVMHIALGHCFKSRKFRNKKIYERACDIVVNSNILFLHFGNESSISIAGQISAHLMPAGDEGYICSVETVYYMIALEILSLESHYEEWEDDFKLDDHGLWYDLEDKSLELKWKKNIEESVKYAKENNGRIPCEVEWMIKVWNTTWKPGQSPFSLV